MPKKKITFFILSFLLICIVFAATYFYRSYETIKENNENITGNKIEGESAEVEDIDLQKSREYNEIKGITNILLLGIDDRGTQEPIRADTIMILTLDDNNKKMKLTSIMRDTYVEIPGHGSEKINHAFAYGGINLLAQTIEKNFSVSLEQYVKINFNGFKDLADSVGGLDVKISNYEAVNELNRCILLEIFDNPKSDLERVKAITDSAGLLGLREEGATLIKDNPSLSKSQYDYISKTAGFLESTGEVHLNGTQLLAYSRMRHIGSGSYERNERQRNVVNLLIDKLKDTPQIKYLSILNKLLPYVKTNIAITDAVNLAYTTYKIDNFNMEQLQMPATKLSDGRIYKNKGWVLLMDKEQNKKILRDFIFNNTVYDEAKYSTFNYKNSEYYYEVPVIQEPSKEMIENKGEKNINDKKDNPPKEVEKGAKIDINIPDNPTESNEDEAVDEGSHEENAEDGVMEKNDIVEDGIENGIENDEESNFEDNAPDMNLQ